MAHFLSKFLQSIRSQDLLNIVLSDHNFCVLYISGDNFRDLTVAVCVWEAPAHDQHSRPTCYLGIFDVNCWYHSQMPASIRCGKLVN